MPPFPLGSNNLHRCDRVKHPYRVGRCSVNRKLMDVAELARVWFSRDPAKVWRLRLPSNARPTVQWDGLAIRPTGATSLFQSVNAGRRIVRFLGLAFAAPAGSPSTRWALAKSFTLITAKLPLRAPTGAFNDP